MTAESAVEAPLTEAELSTRLLVIAALLDRVKAVDADLRRQVRDRFTVGDRKSGVLDPTRAKDTKLGTVTLAEPSEYVSVQDDAAFFAWVMEEHADELETVVQVKPVFRNAVLDAVKRDGGWPDPETGELVEVPGVVKRVGDPTPKVVKAKGVDLDALLAEAIASGKLKEITS